MHLPNVSWRCQNSDVVNFWPKRHMSSFQPMVTSQVAEITILEKKKSIGGCSSSTFTASWPDLTVHFLPIITQMMHHELLNISAIRQAFRQSFQKKKLIGRDEGTHQPPTPQATVKIGLMGIPSTWKITDWQARCTCFNAKKILLLENLSVDKNP